MTDLYTPCVIGIDPGVSGGAVLLNGDHGGVQRVERLPVVKMFGQDRAVIEDFTLFFSLDNLDASVICFIEEIEAYGRVTSKKSLRTAAISWGMIAHAAAICPWINEIRTVRPVLWQKTMLADMPGETTKDKARAAVDAIWPEYQAWPRDRKGRIRDGVADAALIAEWGRRQLQAEREKP